MKLGLMFPSFSLIAGILFSTSSVAARLPDCWTVDGRSIGFNRAGDEIADGQWLLNVNLKRATKEDLVWLISRISRGQLDFGGYPIIFEPDYMILHARLRVADGPRDARKRSADAQLAEIARRQAVETVECNGIAHPQ